MLDVTFLKDDCINLELLLSNYLVSIKKLEEYRGRVECEQLLQTECSLEKIQYISKDEFHLVPDT